MGIEPTTFSLATSGSTSELPPQFNSGVDLPANPEKEFNGLPAGCRSQSKNLGYKYTARN